MADFNVTAYLRDNLLLEGEGLKVIMAFKNEYPDDYNQLKQYAVDEHAILYPES